MQRTINVTAEVTVSGWTCHVRVVENSRPVTEHMVTVTKADLERYAPDKTVGELITRSFEFLLEREPPTSILRTFALPDIERYFPDYAQTIRSKGR